MEIVNKVRMKGWTVLSQCRTDPPARAQVCLEARRALCWALTGPSVAMHGVGGRDNDTNQDGPQAECSGQKAKSQAGEVASWVTSLSLKQGSVFNPLEPNLKKKKKWHSPVILALGE